MTLHSTDNRVSASLLALGFAGELRSTIHASTRQYVHEVKFSTPSTRFPQLDPGLIVQHWKQSRCLRPLMRGAEELLPAEPMHAFACAMRAQESYDAFLGALKTGRIPRLVPDASHLFHRYNVNEVIAFTVPPTTPCDDMQLAAASAPLGIPLISITGSHRAHVFHLAAMGEPVQDALGAWIRHTTTDILRRAPTRDDPRRLALEDTQPMHPLCIGYESLAARAALKRKIEKAEASIIITAADGGSKQALIAINHAGHVARAVERHFQCAPGALGL